MRTIGKYIGANRTIDGDLTITFEIDDDYRALDSLKGFGESDLVVEVSKYHEKKTKNANDYFWVLCTKMAKALGSDKDSVYLMQLHKYGTFEDIRIKKEGVNRLKETFRLAEVFEEYGLDEGFVKVRCYWGISTYDRAEMAYLIDRTVEDAKDLGVDTWTQDEILRLLASWGENNDAKGNGA